MFNPKTTSKISWCVNEFLEIKDNFGNNRNILAKGQ